MQAKVTKEFPGRPDDATMPRMIAVGETIGGELAAVAVEHGWAEKVSEESAPPAKGKTKK